MGKDGGRALAASSPIQKATKVTDYLR